MPRPGVFSIELVAELLREHLPDRFEVIDAVNPFPASGVVPRARAIAWARGVRVDVAHVVGDVNFLALGTDPARTVLTVHDLEFLERARGPKAALYRLLWLRLPSRRAAVVTTPTAAVRDELVAVTGIDPDAVRVVPDPVDPAFVHVARTFGDPPVVLQVGTRSNKNLERVARALEGITCRLVVVGRLSPAQTALMQACGVAFEERVDLSREEIVTAYRDADLVTFVSTTEGFGVPIVEAQASGRPVVIGDVAPLPEVAGEGACRVDPYDVAAIRAGIRRVLEDASYREELVAAGLRNAERFEAGRVAGAFAAIYDELAASAASRS
jgi:glycosyltransferase involved in cell wall biosynthesis